MIFEIFVGLSIGLILAILGYVSKHYGTLEAMGIPVVKPFLIFGSPPFLFHKIQVHEHNLQMHRKLGKTFGRYSGRTPFVFTIDPELIKEILVKQFDNFTDMVDWDLSDEKLTLDLSGGEKWRALRKALSPTFSSGKLKGMLDLMGTSVDNLISHLTKEVNKNPVVELKAVFQAFALDTIAACAFGVNTNSHTNESNEILDNGRKLFSVFQTKSIVEDIVQAFMGMFPFIISYLGIYTSAYDNLYKITKQIMQERKSMKIDKGDFVGRLNDILNHLEKPLSEELVIAQGVIFFAAGFETTANTLSTFSYYLALNPDIQERIYEEIQEALENSNGKLDQETINLMPYLEAALNENLRIVGPASEQFRVCTRDCEVNGLKFKKGTWVQMPIYAAHHLEEFFPEPERFMPERFLKENQSLIKPYTFRPFGGGNRICIGQRFAINEMKMCVAKLLSKFKLEKAPKTNLKLETGSLGLLLFNEIYLKFVPRN